MAQFQVHKTINNTARLVVMNHPNAFDAICFERFFTQPEGNRIAGINVLGGEDNSEIDYRLFGNAKVLFIDPWQVSKIISDNINGNDARVKMMALIEPDVEGEFELHKGDVFYLYIDEGMGLAYEIVGIELPVGLSTSINAKRYLLNKRDDLDYIAAFDTP